MKGGDGGVKKTSYREVILLATREYILNKWNETPFESKKGKLYFKAIRLIDKIYLL